MKYLITFDASFDAAQAGLDAGELRVQFFKAAREIAEERGIEIRIVEPGDRDYMALSGRDEDEETKLWQAIHDRAGAAARKLTLGR